MVAQLGTDTFEFIRKSSILTLILLCCLSANRKDTDTGIERIRSLNMEYNMTLTLLYCLLVYGQCSVSVRDSGLTHNIQNKWAILFQHL